MIDLSFAEYLWLDGAKPSEQMHSKTRVLSLPKEPNVDDFPQWRFNGSFTGQSDKYESDCILRPVRVYRDPFRGPKDHIVLCEVRDSGGNTHESNKRALLRAVIKNGDDELAAWLGCEQKYTLAANDRSSTGSKNTTPTSVITSYCGIGGENVFRRDVVEAHSRACIAAGIRLSSVNAGVMLGQWEFQIGYRGIEGEACDVLTVADDLWLARYLLNRIGEESEVHVSFDNKSTGSNGCLASMPVYFSTAFTRDPRCGPTAIQAIASSLASRRYDQITTYDEWQAERCSEESDRSKAETIKSARTCGDDAIRIPCHVRHRGYGYIEDRRPVANANPYVIGIYLMYAATNKTINSATY